MDDSGREPWNLAYTDNHVLVMPDFDESEIQTIINMYLGYVNAVSGEMFFMTTGTGSGWEVIDGNGDTECEDGALGCTRWYMLSNDRIASFDIHINLDADWAIYSQRSVMTHELGHAFGLWHAYGIFCPPCGETTLPTMTDVAYCPSTCNGCGQLAMYPFWWDLADADITELQSRYYGAVLVDPGQETEPNLPDPGQGRFARPVHITNFPNPFNPRTEFLLTTDVDGPASTQYKLDVFDISGRFVFGYSGSIEGGQEEVAWAGLDEVGRPAPAGIYTVRVITEGGVASRKIALLK